MTDTPTTPDPLQAWVAELTALLHLPDEVDVATVLDVARDAAHGVARPAAPLTTFVLGLAVGRAAASGAESRAELARLAPLVQDLATRGTPA